MACFWIWEYASILFNGIDTLDSSLFEGPAEFSFPHNGLVVLEMEESIPIFN